jgi:hypothetical protein
MGGIYLVTGQEGNGLGIRFGLVCLYFSHGIGVRCRQSSDVEHALWQ